MTYSGHRTGVTTGSSTQPGESVQLLTPRNESLWPKAKAFASLSHWNAPNADQRLLLKNAALESSAIQQLKTEETVLKGSN